MNPKTLIIISCVKQIVIKFCFDFRVQQSLNQMQMNDITENVSKVKETEYLSKKTSEYASHIRHLEVSKKV